MAVTVYHRWLLHSCCCDHATQLAACLSAAVLHRGPIFKIFSPDRFQLNWQRSSMMKGNDESHGNTRTAAWMLCIVRISADSTMMLMWWQLSCGWPTGCWIHLAIIRTVVMLVSAADYRSTLWSSKDCGNCDETVLGAITVSLLRLSHVDACDYYANAYCND